MDKMYLVTIEGRFDRILQTSIQDAEYYAIMRAVACGYTPRWRTERDSNDIEYGMAYDNKYTGMLVIREITPITSIEERRYSEWKDDDRKEQREIWKRFAEENQGIDYVDFPLASEDNS